MQRYSRFSNLTRRAVPNFSLTRIPTAGDSSRNWGSPFVPGIGTEGEVVRRRGAAVLGMCRRCRQAPATTTIVGAPAVLAAAREMVVADDPARLARPVHQVRPEVHQVRPEVRLVRPEVRLAHQVRPAHPARLARPVHQVRPEVRPVRPEVRLVRPEVPPEARQARPEVHHVRPAHP
jgi:hypothetical protein